MERFAPVENCQLMFIAGEASGDEHAAALVKKIKAQNPEIKIAALGGRCLHDAEAIILDDLTAHAAVGLWEVLKKIDVFLKLLKETVDWIDANRPKRVVFVDFVGFNLEVAKRLFEKKISKKGGGNVELYFYISPQIWAWKKNRRFKMAKHLDSLGVIFPFEVDYYKDTTLPVEFVGHPFVEDGFKNPLSYDANGPVVLLPGSRKAIVKMHLPVLWEAFQAYQKQNPAAKAAAYYPSEERRQQMIELTDGKLPLYPSGAPIKASAAVCTAGTIALTTALAGVPSALIYKTDALTCAFARIVLKLPFLGIANIFLKRELQKELLQEDFTPQKVTAEIERLKSDKDALRKAQEGAEELKSLLKTPSKRTAVEWLLAGI